jgi:hypothetical protein
MMIVTAKKDNHVKEEIRMNEHMTHKLKQPVPPHERKGMIVLQFEEGDWKVFKEAFGDEDTAAAAVEIVHSAPPEIQILVAQVLDMIEKEAE